MSAICDFTAGWISGMAGLAVGYPFDTIKVIQQTQGIGMLQSIRKIHQSYGLTGYFRGLGFPLLSSGAVNSLVFGVYHSTIREINKMHGTKWYMDTKEEINIYLGQEEIPPHVIPYTDFFIAGALSGLVSVGVSCPIELIKIKIQTGQTAAMGKTAVENFQKGPYHAVRYVVKKEGFRGLYRGYTAMSLRDSIGNGVYMLSYEILADFVRASNKDHSSAATMFGLFMAGGCAGTVSWWAGIPVDVVKSKIQADDPVNPKYSRRFVECFRQVARESGIRGLYSGFIPLTLRSFPVNGATFLSFELLYRFCHTTTETNLFNLGKSKRKD